MTAGRACFYAAVGDPALLDLIEFYRLEMDILRDLGYELVRATRPRDIPWNADLYYTYWWATGVPTLVPSLLRGRPNLFTGYHHYFQPGWDWHPVGLQPKLRVKQVLMRSAMALASANVLNSREEFGVVRHIKLRNPHYVPQCIDSSFHRPDPSAEREHLLTISHLTVPNVRRKMIIEIVQAFALVLRERPEERLVIVGDRGNGYHLVRAAVDQLGIADRVHFAGLVSREEKRDLLRRAKAYVQPSRYEGFGMAIAEAMACDTPVIVSRAGAVTEVVGDAGRYFEGDTSADLAAGILRALSDRAGTADLVRIGRARIVDHFSYERRREGIAAVLGTL